VERDAGRAGGRGLVGGAVLTWGVFMRGVLMVGVLAGGLLDRGSIETFVNGGEISSTRFALPKGDGVRMRAEGGDVVVHRATLTALKPAWPLVRG